MKQTICDNCGTLALDDEAWWSLGNLTDDYDLCSARCVEAMGARLETSAESP